LGRFPSELAQPQLAHALSDPDATVRARFTALAIDEVPAMSMIGFVPPGAAATFQPSKEAGW
jgi:hypothetical protein